MKIQLQLTVQGRGVITRACGLGPNETTACRRRSTALRGLSNRTLITSRVRIRNNHPSSLKRGQEPLFNELAEREGLFGPSALTPAGPPLRGVQPRCARLSNLIDDFIEGSNSSSFSSK